MDYTEEYQQIANQNGFLFEDNRSEIKVFGSDNGNMVRAEYVTMKKGDVIYCASDMYAPKAYMNSTYSGFYSLIYSNPLDLECNINHRINPVMDLLLSGIGKKTGNKLIDEHLMIKTNDIKAIQNYITEEVLEKYLELRSKMSPAIILFGKGDDLLPSFPFFKEKAIVGIQTTEWIQPEKLIDLFNSCSDILNSMPSIHK